MARPAASDEATRPRPGTLALVSREDVIVAADVDEGASGRARRWWRPLFVGAVAVQLVVLYVPRAVSPPGGFPWDKVVHALIFGAAAWTGAKAGVRLRWLVAALLAHALISEGIQHWFLPHRSGDLRDSVADATGTLLATLLVVRPWRRRP